MCCMKVYERIVIGSNILFLFKDNECNIIIINIYNLIKDNYDYSEWSSIFS